MRSVLDEFEQCREDSKFQAEPRCMFLSGLAGSGKSLSIKAYAQKHPRRNNGAWTAIPVLQTLVPAPGAIGAMVTALLRAIDGPLPSAGSIEERSHRLRVQMKRCGVEIVILDEFQHLVMPGQASLRKHTTDWLKNLITETRVPIVLVGQKEAAAILDEDSQLKRRYSIRHELRPYAWKDGQRQAQFLKFLEEVDQGLPFDERAGLAEKNTAVAIYQASSGMPALFMKLIRGAAQRALKADAKRVRKEDLCEIYDRYLNHNAGLFPNPFRTQPALSSLVAPGHWLA